jgi:pimeloyl-[acyl-carrier protein] methyl ester esterase
MCRDRRTLELFLAHQPERKIDDQRQELENLLQITDCLSVDASIYTDVVIAANDYILPASNQRRFWRQKKVHIIDGYHFLFYGWNSWDELIHDPGKLRPDQKC